MAQDKFDFWRTRLADSDITTVRAEVANYNIHSGGEYRRAGEAVIKEYEEKQEDERNSKRDEREERTLELAQKAHERADKSYQQSWLAIGIAGVTAFVTIAIAFIKQ